VVSRIQFIRKALARLRRRGFTLAECMVALLFLSIAVFGYFGLHVRLIHSAGLLENRQRHRQIVQRMLTRSVAVLARNPTATPSTEPEVTGMTPSPGAAPGASASPSASLASGDPPPVVDPISIPNTIAVEYGVGVLQGLDRVSVHLDWTDRTGYMQRVQVETLECGEDAGW